MSDTVRVRFAPSPTGQLHVGSARTALYNWAFARGNDGVFILRIDDTDPERSTTENVDAILEAMRWLGLEWDEGPDAGGEHGPYYQTQRTAFYDEALQRLVSQGSVYPCFCSVEELEERREAARREQDDFQGYDRTCRDIDTDEASNRIDSGASFVWRLAVPDDHGDIVLSDSVRGEVSFPIASMDDMVVVRTDGSPTYNFATVVDDETMGITHVIRGDDHLSNTPRQILVFEALGYPIPQFAHMSMTFGPDGKRLSKRHGATSVEAFRDMGFLPEALLNYIALLGWSLDDKTTIMDRDTITGNFSLDRLSANPGIFDIEKLEWMNGVYIRESSVDDFRELIVATLYKAGLITADDLTERAEWFTELATLLQERVKRLDEIPGMVAFLFSDDVTPDEDSIDKVLRKEGAGRALDAAAEVLGSLTEFSIGPVEEALRALPETLELKAKVVFQSVRVAVSGSTVSPPLFESLGLLGKERVLERIRQARTLATD